MKTALISPVTPLDLSINIGQQAMRTDSARQPVLDGIRGIAILLLLICHPASVSAQEWKSWGSDPGGTRFSALTQINRSNVRNLREVWTYHTGEASAGLRNFEPSRVEPFETTPLVVGDAMYLSTPSGRIIALDAESGKELWRFDSQSTRPLSLFRVTAAGLFIGSLFLAIRISTRRRNLARSHSVACVGIGLFGLTAPRMEILRFPRVSHAHRGVAFWQDSEGRDRRILFGTFEPGLKCRLIELDARSGKPELAFGDHGSVDLRSGVADRWASAIYANTSPPAIYKNLVIIGAEVPEGPSRGPSGEVRAFDVITGKLAWTFHTIPTDDEPGGDTWTVESRKDRTGANVWSIMSVDVEHGMVFLPVGSASYDFYGGDRKGPNLFANCLVALDASTGKLIWYYQMVHHDLWDYDLPAQPVLATIRKDQRQIPAVVQVTKMGLVFILDRMTGKPLFPVEERSVKASEIPGESAWPTQPFPLKPSPLSSQHVNLDSIRMAGRCTDMSKTLHRADIYTPFGNSMSLEAPGEYGGGNWSGGSFEPSSGRFFVNTNNLFSIGRIEAQPAGSDFLFKRTSPWGEHAFFWDDDQTPCQQPPWGLLSAVDLSSGAIAWQVPLGVTDAGRTGTPNLGGSIATAGGVVFIGATQDHMFRAFDSSDGRELWSSNLPAAAHATPLTFLGTSTGKQYVVVAAGGGGIFKGAVSDSIVAFGLPD